MLRKSIKDTLKINFELEVKTKNKFMSASYYESNIQTHVLVAKYTRYGLITAYIAVLNSTYSRVRR